MPATVLVVDDDSAIRDALFECLRDDGYDVHTAEHGQAALGSLDEGVRPDVIVLDLMMPIMNGFEFLQALKRRPGSHGIRVVILSANQGYKAEDFEPSVFRMLRKPVSVQCLSKTIELALAK